MRAGYLKRVIIAAAAFAALAAAAAGAAEAGTISGKVTDPDGRYLRGVLVEVIGENLNAKTDAYGYYGIREVPAGKYEVKASRHGFDEQVKSSVKVLTGLRTDVSFQLQPYYTGVTVIRTEEPLVRYRDLLYRYPAYPKKQLDSDIVDEFAEMLVSTRGLVYEDSDAATLNLHIRASRDGEAAEAGTISGSVTDQNDRPLSGVLVVLLGTNLFTTTNADGYYVIQKVPAGTFAVKATHSGCEEQVKTRVKVIAGLRTDVSFELYKIPVGVILVAPEDPPFWYRDLLYRYPAFPKETVDSEIVDEFAEMLVRTPGLVYEDGDASTPDEEATGDSEAAEAGTISGVVTDQDGYPVDGALIEVEGTALFAKSNAVGYYSIPEVPAGTFDVKATHLKYIEQVETGAKVTPGGDTTVSFQLESVFKLLHE
jgi:protocatechuate 3,4-dioxygenase beta subunit